MKKIVLSVFCILLFTGSGVLAEEAHAPKISLKEVRYDAGKVKQGTQVTHVFEIFNAGTAPLVIERLQPS